MTDTIKDGGQAFPSVNPTYDGNWDKRRQIDGMTLRDYFAGQYMVSERFRGVCARIAAKSAYEYADAMLEARELRND